MSRKHRRTHRKSRKVHRKSHKKSRRTRRTRKLSKKFGSKSSLLNYMGNFRPPAEMSLAQSFVGNGPNQQMNHVNNIPQGLRANFYV